MPLTVQTREWTVTDDRNLIAAVARYGLNQWARISQLLERRTPRQCRARWIYLDRRAVYLERQALARRYIYVPEI
jgi:Myb-like DNA-binding domain